MISIDVAKRAVTISGHGPPWVSNVARLLECRPRQLRQVPSRLTLSPEPDEVGLDGRDDQADPHAYPGSDRVAVTTGAFGEDLDQCDQRDEEAQPSRDNQEKWLHLVDRLTHRRPQ